MNCNPTSIYKVHNGKSWEILHRPFKVGDVISEIIPDYPLQEINGHLIIEIIEKSKSQFARFIQVRIKDNIFYCVQKLNDKDFNFKYLGIVHGLDCYQILRCKNDISNANFIVSDNSTEGVNENNNDNGERRG